VHYSGLLLCKNKFFYFNSAATNSLSIAYPIVVIADLPGLLVFAAAILRLYDGSCG